MKTQFQTLFTTNHKFLSRLDCENSNLMNKTLFKLPSWRPKSYNKLLLKNYWGVTNTNSHDFKSLVNWLAFSLGPKSANSGTVKGQRRPKPGAICSTCTVPGSQSKGDETKGRRGRSAGEDAPG